MLTIHTKPFSYIHVLVRKLKKIICRIFKYLSEILNKMQCITEVVYKKIKVHS